MTRVVVATPDSVGTRMAGPGIRAHHLAIELARHFDTTLIARLEPGFDARVPSLPSGSGAARRAIASAEVVVSQPTREVLSIRPEAAQRRVYDLFDPVLLELRELYGSHSTLRQRLHMFMEARRMRQALKAADAVMIAAPAQRRYFERFHARPDADWLQVSFGCEVFENDARVDASPVPTVVWNGGVWSWLDPGTAIEAVASVNETGTPCRLLFMGARRPAFSSADPSQGDRSSSEHVVWNEQWVPYAERAGWLRECKVAIMLHRQTAEAEFSVRTRLFDAIAAGLPVVCSRGGYAAELVERHELGLVVQPESVSAVAASIRRLLLDDDFYGSCVSNMRKLAPDLSWERVVAPLVTRIHEWQVHR